MKLLNPVLSKTMQYTNRKLIWNTGLSIFGLFCSICLPTKRSHYSHSRMVKSIVMYCTMKDPGCLLLTVWHDLVGSYLISQSLVMLIPGCGNLLLINEHYCTSPPHTRLKWPLVADGHYFYFWLYNEHSQESSAKNKNYSGCMLKSCIFAQN